MRCLRAIVWETIPLSTNGRAVVNEGREIVDVVGGLRYYSTTATTAISHIDLNDSDVGGSTVVIDGPVAEVVRPGSRRCDVGEVTGGVVIEEERSPGIGVVQIEDEFISINIGDIVNEEVGLIIPGCYVKGSQVFSKWTIARHSADDRRDIAWAVEVVDVLGLTVGEGVDSKEVLFVVL